MLEMSGAKLHHFPDATNGPRGRCLEFSRLGFHKRTWRTWSILHVSVLRRANTKKVLFKEKRDLCL